MWPFRINLSLLILPLLLASCAVGPNFHPPAAPPVNSYTAKPMPYRTAGAKGPGGQSQTFDFGADIPYGWWELFHSPELDYLVRLGLAHSPTLAAAESALKEAQANWWAEVGSGLFPLITASFTAQRERFNNASFGGAGSSSSSGGTSNTSSPMAVTFNLFNAQINYSYTLDVFGGIRRQIEAYGAQVDYQQFELAAAYLTLTANIVSTAISEASYREQIKATNELIETLTQTLNMVNNQYSLGAVTLAQVLSQQTQLAQVRATLPGLEKSLSQSRHALAALVGFLPAQIAIPEFNLSDLTLPRHIPVILPARLIRQRPDVRAAESLMHIALAQIGVATANLLPQFTLNGYVGWEANTLGQLFKKKSLIWDLEGGVMQTIFNGGALISRRNASIYAYRQALAQYRQTVIQAYQNVADALRAVEYDALALRAQSEGESAARQTLALFRGQFQLGGASFLDVLTAQYQYQQVHLARVQAESQRYVDTAALFQALGGGWWNQYVDP